MAVAGNVGTALTSLAGALDARRRPSCWRRRRFQLEDTDAFAPECAVLLNLAPDHLDRHGSFEAYARAKLRVFAHQGNDDVAVAPDDLGVEDLGGCARRVCFGTGPEAELGDRGGALWWDRELLVRHEELALRGAHNRRNAMAAAAAALARGIPADAVREALRTFPGVEHRLEEVAVLDGVTYVNDSKATNVASTVVALASFDRPVRLIAGGLAKGQDFGPLAGPVREHCASVHLVGRDAGLLRDALAPTGVALDDAGDLGRAVARRDRGRARPATSCCSRRRARASTSSPTSRPAGGASRPSSRAGRRTAAGGEGRRTCAPPPPGAPRPRAARRASTAPRWRSRSSTTSC